MLEKPLHIHILAVAALGPGVSGGDKIFMESARVWATQGHIVTIYVTEEGYDMCQRYALKDVRFVTLQARRWLKISFALHYLMKTIGAILMACRTAFDSAKPHVIYSAGDSLPDVFPAWILHLRHPAARWVAGFYFFAPAPWKSTWDKAYRGGKQPLSLRSFLYFLLQQLAYPLVRRNAHAFIVANYLDVERMQKDGVSSSFIYPIYGGVDLPAIQAIPDPAEKSFEGVFVGRFHIQKGPLVLLNIWARVVEQIPGARLAVIGEGPLREEMDRTVQQLGLQKNVRILGYIDGTEKYKILKSSRVFLHTPTFDTGGMAAAEAMACGLPVVGFDLPGYRYCYPRGMVKARLQDEADFARWVIELLTNPAAHETVRNDAVDFVRSWDWKARVGEMEHLMHHPEPPTSDS